MDKLDISLDGSWETEILTKEEILSLLEVSWLDNYDLPKLNELYAIGEPIKETTEEQYRPYFEFANSTYYNFQVLEKHKDSIKELLVSNFGIVKYNGLIIPSTLVANGPNKGVNGGKIDHYREILFPGLPIKRHVFKTYRLVAEVWCNNPDPKIYTTVHHIGNDSFDNKSNLLFVTQGQHLAIRHVKPEKLDFSTLTEEDFLLDYPIYPNIPALLQALESNKKK